MPKQPSRRKANAADQLTSRQRQILDLIRSSLQKTGMPPTRADICEAFHFRSPTAAEDHLRALERKGVIELLPGRSRGIRLLAPGKEIGIPLVGRVAAGEPILAEQHIEDYFELDPGFFQPRANYLLRVRGHSMRDGGILNGDLLAVHRTREASSGQIVVARLEDEVTVKRFRRRGNKVTLEPHNPDFEPIQLDLREDDLVIEGLGVGVIRNRKL
ncbi:MAG: transcriptional repressor LexA [Arenicellales bacterium]